MRILIDYVWWATISEVQTLKDYWWDKKDLSSNSNIIFKSIAC